MDWVENHIADALGYPVFSIGQEILFEWDNQIQLAVIDSYVISTDINGELNIQYLIVLIEDNYYWGDVQSHDELLKLNPIANNLPTSRKHCNDC